MQTRYNTYFVVIVCDIYMIPNAIQLYNYKVRIHLNAFNLEIIHDISIFPR